MTIVLSMFVGIAIMLFPTAANWYSTLGYQEEYGAYVSQQGKLSEAEIDQILNSARVYNRNLPNGPLRDPYLLNASGKAENLSDGISEYNNQLNIGNDQPMAMVRVPSVGISLPVRHGTSDAILDKSAGHLYGSALPVGGESTHAVITAHSGRVDSKFFSDLHQVKVGETFYVEVLGREFHYRVEKILKIEPDSGDELRQVPGKDYLTLVTCTPIGVNSHRLLVRGERIPTPPRAENDLIRSTGFERAFPWWLVILIGAPILMWLSLSWFDKRKERPVGGRHAYRSTHKSAKRRTRIE